MYREEVNGKVVVASNPQELAEGVAAVKAEVTAVAPDITNPKDGNKIVSPDNKHTEEPYVQPVPQVPEEKNTESDSKKSESKKIPVIVNKRKTLKSSRK